MKNRWMGLVLIALLSLAACAPAQQGADDTPEPAGASPEQSVEMASPAASSDDSGGGDPDDYDY